MSSVTVLGQKTRSPFQAMRPSKPIIMNKPTFRPVAVSQTLSSPLEEWGGVDEGVESMELLPSGNHAPFVGAGTHSFLSGHRKSVGDGKGWWLF